MSKSYQQFKNMVLGRAYDIDCAYGAQCWDGAMYYSKWLGYPVYNCRVTGYAQDIWTQRKSSGILNYYNEVSTMQAGDIVVFKQHPYTPYSHIAIFDRDAGNGWGWFLGQNQGGAGGAFNLVKLPYEATYATAFRPKCFAGNAVQKPSSTSNSSSTKWDMNATLKVGDTVKSKSLAIQGIYGDLVQVDELGGMVPLSDVAEASNTGDGKCDDYLATTAARIYLLPTKVQAVNGSNNTVKVNNYWIKAEPLCAKR